jgi:hypothetical protein
MLTNKNKFFAKFFLLITICTHCRCMYINLNDNSHLEVRKQLKSRVFLNLLLVDERIRSRTHNCKSGSGMPKNRAGSGTLEDVIS